MLFISLFMKWQDLRVQFMKSVLRKILVHRTVHSAIQRAKW